MKRLNDIFRKDYARTIETVIKADDQEHIYQEVDEYVITKDVSKKLSDFFEAYNDAGGTNGVWISGFFGSGKSHLLKILSYALENRELTGQKLGELFAEKSIDDVKLKADIQNAIRKFQSESILFNIDQQAQITSKTDANAILQVFYKVFYDHQGFYGFQPHVAEFESYLSKEGKYIAFKTAFEADYHKSWEEARKDYVDPLISDAIAQACGEIYNQDPEKYEDYLDTWEDKQKFSIEDFALKVNDYIRSKPGNFRLNFFVDEVGQYIAENTKLMLNLQTIAESLNTRCGGNSWVIVTSQEDLESLVGDDSGIQSDDFSKIQGRFRVRMPLTSSNVDEVIERRLLEKNEDGTTNLDKFYTQEGDNIKTLLSFTEAGMQFKGYQGNSDFVRKYPFIPYQFDLFQQCIKALSRHNVFQGKHQSVGERSMLGVFQEVLKNSGFTSIDSIVSFDKMFEGIRASLRAESQNSILLAEKQLTDQLAIRVLKVLFLIKYYDSFKSTARNISVLLLDTLKTNSVNHLKAIEVALNLLEQQTYIQRKGEIYEFLTNDEKDIEDEIKNTEIDNAQVGLLLNELVFDGIIKDQKIRYVTNKQDFEFTRRVDGSLYGREKELKIEVVSPNGDNYNNDSYFSGTSMGDNTLMIVKLPEDKRLIHEVRLAIKTDKYIKQNQSSSNNESKTRILYDKGQQNRERKRLLENSLSSLLAQSAIFMGGSEYRGSSSSDGKIKLLDASQSLIQLAYPKLEQLGSKNLDEAQLRLIMSKGQPDLFGGDDSIISAPEKEMLNLIERRKNQHDRTSLSDLKDHFSKKPYGWSQMAIWCVCALLFKRGKIEAKQDTNILDDAAFMDALNNNRNWLNTLVVPQVEFDRSQINNLKKFYQDAFDETNPFSEAKEVANLFKQKARAEELEINTLLAQSKQYPFVKSLEPLAAALGKLSEMDYATLLTNFSEFEENVLRDKEEILNPIRQFWAGEQKNIFDRIGVFQTGNQANFDYIDAAEKLKLSEIHESPNPYGGNQMRQAKDAMDVLEKRITSKIEEERVAIVEEVNNKKLQIQQQEGFEKLSTALQDSLMQPFSDVINKANSQVYIANLILERDTLGALLTKQLNELERIAAKEKGEEDSGEVPPQDLFINVRNVEKHIQFSKSQLASEQDVEDYIQQLRTEMMKQISANRKITLN
jgi:hypothetical protein